MPDLKNKRLKILFHGEFNFDTGFAGVATNIVDRLHNLKTEWGTKKYDIFVMQLGKHQEPFMAPDNKPYPVIPMYGNSQAAPFGQDYAQDLVRRIKPDIVLTFGDIWMQTFWNDTNCIPADLRKTFKLVAYTAIDGYPIPRFWVDYMKDFDKVITFTQFGKDTIDERAKEMGVELNTSFVYHGVDTQIFRPLPKEDIDNFKAQRNVQDKKIIGMFSRNQPRKHHPEFIEFASELLAKYENRPDILFYFHTIERDAGWDLTALIADIEQYNLRARFKKYGTVGPNQEIPEKKYSIKDRFFFPGINNPAQGYPLPMLNMMYNICDAHVLCTSGEGFGCTVSESLAAGVPTFTNDYAASAELIKNSGGGEVFSAREFTYRGQDHNFYRPHTNFEDLIAKVTPVLDDPELKRKYSKKGKAWALNMNWDLIIMDWEKELEDIYNYENKKIKAEIL